MYEAQTIVTLLRWWLYAGTGVALLFVLWGIDRVDPSARGAYLFRPLIVPGVVLLWPLVLWYWWHRTRAQAEWPDGYKALRGTAHQIAWLLLTVVLAGLLIAALTIRQEWPQGRQPILLETPQHTQQEQVR